MAKRQDNPLKDLFSKTEPEPPAQPEEAPAPSATLADADDVLPARGALRSVGVGLYQSELEAVDALAAELGTKRNALLRYAVRYLLSQHRAGELTIERDRVSGRLVLP
jgi:hypothetical protein